MRPIYHGILILLFLGVAGHAGATINWPRAEEDARMSEQCSSPSPANVPAITTSQPDARVAAYEKYYQSSLEHRAAVFQWQATAGKLIFALVSILVLSGLAFAAVQFYVALRRGSADITQELEVTLQAVKVRSQFLGVITLILSLGFFYLYLRNVYPIVVNPTPTTEAAPK
jgi:hypothetical protein